MKVVATIEARMKSSRLPEKVMLPINNRPMLEVMITRLQYARNLDKIVIATTKDKSDDVIVKLAKRLKVGWYRGSQNDVLSRVLEAATKYKADLIIELTGDCPLVDPALVDQAIDKFKSAKVDYLATNTIKPLAPPGFDIQIFPRRVLDEVAQLTDDSYDHEHVSLYIYEHPQKFRLQTFAPPKPLQRPDIRLTIDTDKDLELVRRVCHLLYQKNPAFTLADTVNLFNYYPQLRQINQQVRQKKARYSQKDEQQIKLKLQTSAYDYVPLKRAAIIGCGNIASTFDDDPKKDFIATHAGAYQTHPHIKLIAAADINQTRLTEFGHRWDVNRLYSDYRQLLAQERPDIVSICTPLGFHYPIVEQALRHKTPVIICEKPFGNNPATAKKLAHQAAKAGTRLLIHYNRRYDPLHLQVQKDIIQGKYGQFLTGTIYYSNGFVNNGCHAIDLILMLLGYIKTVQVVGTKAPKTDPTLDVVLTLMGGQIVTLQAVDARSNYLFEADFLFEKTRLKLEDVGRKIIRIPSVPNPHASNTNTYAGQPQKKIGILPQSLPSLLGLIMTKDSKLASNALTSVQVLEIMAAVLKSRKHSGKLIHLPLKNPNMVISSQALSV